MRRLLLVSTRCGDLHPYTSSPSVDVRAHPTRGLDVQIHGRFVAWRAYDAHADRLVLQVRDWRTGALVWVSLSSLAPIWG